MVLVVLLVICRTAIEISLRSWGEGCPGKPSLVISIMQGIKEIRMNFSNIAFFWGFFFILKPTLPELCPFTGCFLLMLKFLSGLARYSQQV